MVFKFFTFLIHLSSRIFTSNNNSIIFEFSVFTLNFLAKTRVVHQIIMFFKLLFNKVKVKNYLYEKFNAKLSLAFNIK